MHEVLSRSGGVCDLDLFERMYLFERMEVG